MAVAAGMKVVSAIFFRRLPCCGCGTQSVGWCRLAMSLAVALRARRGQSIQEVARSEVLTFPWTW